MLLRIALGVVIATGLLSQGPALGWGGASARIDPPAPPRPGDGEDWVLEGRPGDFRASSSPLGAHAAARPETHGTGDPSDGWDERLDSILAAGQGRAGVAGALGQFEPAIEAPVVLAAATAAPGFGWTQTGRPLAFQLGGPGVFLEDPEDPTTVPEPHGLGLAILGAAALLLRRAGRGRA